MKRCRTKDGRERGENGKEGRKREGGGGEKKAHVGGGTVNIIKSVRDGGSMCAAERARSAFLHECLGLFAL